MEDMFGRGALMLIIWKFVQGNHRSLRGAGILQVSKGARLVLAILISQLVEQVMIVLTFHCTSPDHGPGDL